MRDTHEGPPEFRWFVGIDWGTRQHAVDVAEGADHAGERAMQLLVDHTSAGLTRLIEWLREVSGGALASVAVAIEVPRGAIVDALLEQGIAVFAVNPKQLDRFRDRFSPAGAKDDSLDAKVLRSAIQTDRQYFRRLTVDEPRVIRVRELTRASEVLQQEFVALTNRLRELVHRVSPAWLSLSANADDPWFWALLEVVATPGLGGTLRRKTLQAMLASYRVRRVTPDDVLDVLAQPALPVAPGTIDAVTSHIQLLLPRVRLVNDQRGRCQRELDHVLAELSAQTVPPPPSRDAGAGGDATVAGPTEAGAGPSDISILRSLPGVGVFVTSTFVADANPLLKARDYQGLRAVTGAAPIRRQTGKNKRGTVSMRYACSLRLRNACYHMSRVSLQHDTRARAYYAALRARGHSHGRALRSVADRWLRILVAMLKHGTLYNAARVA
jgi:transposase